MDQLRIVVGFKVTPDYEALRPSDWARAADDAPDGRPRGPETRYVRRILGVFDEAALELALRLRDARAARGLETSLAAFSAAGREADPFLKTLQALGFERAARVEAGAELDFAPAATAALVAAGTQQLGGDVLLLGSRSSPDDNDAVPFLVAEALGRPCLTQVTELEPAERGRLRVTFTADAGPVRATIATPCVLAVGNALVSMLRVPTLKDRLATKDEPVVASLSGRPRRRRRRRARSRAGHARRARDRRPRPRRRRRRRRDGGGQGARAVRDPPARTAGAPVTRPADTRAHRGRPGRHCRDGGAAGTGAGRFLRDGLRLAGGRPPTPSRTSSTRKRRNGSRLSARADERCAPDPHSPVPARPAGRRTHPLGRGRRRRAPPLPRRPDRHGTGGAHRRPSRRQRPHRRPRSGSDARGALLPPQRLLEPPHRPLRAAPASLVHRPGCELVRRPASATTAHSVQAAAEMPAGGSLRRAPLDDVELLEPPATATLRRRGSSSSPAVAPGAATACSA